MKCCCVKNTKTEKAKREEPREGEEEEAAFWNGFEPDSKKFSRDRSSLKSLGKLYKLCIDFQALKIE